MDTKLEYQILIIFFSVDYNNRDNDKKQKETYAKLNNINKWMETAHRQTRQKQTGPNILPQWSIPIRKFHHYKVGNLRKLLRCGL